MPATLKLVTAAAVISGLALVAVPSPLRAAPQEHGSLKPVALRASEIGSIQGEVRGEDGVPLAGAVVSAVSRFPIFAVTDRQGRFELDSLAPGSYLVQAQLGGFVASRTKVVLVRKGTRAISNVSLRREEVRRPLLAAGLGVRADAPNEVEETPTEDAAAPAPDHDHSELAWRVRHTRRGILRGTSEADDPLDEPDVDLVDDPMVGEFIEQGMSPARFATAFFAETPFSGQVNLLTSGSFDQPDQLFSSAGLGRGIAYVALSAPVGTRGDWTVRGALTEADVSAWIVAASYATRAPARHRYDLGLSYSTQRYGGGNPLALRDVTDGSRNVGTVYGFDTFTINPAVSVGFGGRYDRYDYLDRRGLISPQLEVTLSPSDRFRIIGVASRLAQAPGAQEFLPPGEGGVWLPPQRTFSTLEPGRPFEAQRATHVAGRIERDVSGATLALGAFHQQITDQLVSLFDAEIPDQPAAKLGHYFVGNVGDARIAGWTAEVRTRVGSRFQGSLAYTLAGARLTPEEDMRYLLLLAPSAVRRDGERIHDLSTTLQADVPETSTRVLVIYRTSNGFARPAKAGGPDGKGTFDSRFDIQVRQSMPAFMNFSGARWEMLLAVRNFFHEASASQSLYDELLVVSPPKRIVGGVTLHF